MISDILRDTGIFGKSRNAERLTVSGCEKALQGIKRLPYVTVRIISFNLISWPDTKADCRFDAFGPVDL